MRRILRDLKIMLLANLWIVPVFAVLIGGLFFFVAPPPPMHARMATGPAGGGYAAFAAKLQAELARQGFDLELVSSAGSLDNLKRLLDEETDVQVALAQSGVEQQLEPAQRQRLHSLGGMYKEPLWLFHRSEVPLDRIADLLPLRLALGAPDSGTQVATEALLAANDIPPSRYPSGWLQAGGQASVDALLAGQLDALFLIAPAENPLVQRLATAPEVSLASFRRAAAYQARLPFFSRVEVGEGLLDLARNAPDHDIVTLAPVATLVINDDFNPALVPLFLEAAREVMKSGTLLDPPGHYPSAQPVTFALSDDAEHYYRNGLPLLQRHLPFRVASLADRYIILLIPLLVLMIPLVKLIGPLYRWRIRARIYRWYKYLRDIDRQLDAGTLPARLDAEIERLENLEDRLAKVEVPLSYSNELYELHVHLRYVIERLHALQRRRTEPPPL